MKIDRELIQRAKEELGDRNGDLIAEALGAEQWNPATRKCLCPWHDDHKPSASYNPKDYTLHCFACGHSSDIIGAYMNGQGMTFTEACREVFNQAGMNVKIDPYTISEEYKLPHEELPVSEKVYEYFQTRGISRETVDKCNVGADYNDNIVFYYYSADDALMMVKYRPSHKVIKGSGENKCWAQKGASTKPLLFNMNRVSFDKPLLICEGETDCIAAIEAGWSNSVACPFGAKTLTWVSECWDFLEQFDSIIVAGDHDEPGETMNKEVIRRLGSYKVKTLELPEYYYDRDRGTRRPINDINEALFLLGKEAVLDAIQNAKEAPIDSVIDIMDVKAMSTENMDGVETGLLPIDRALGKLYYGTLTILSGSPGAGKTSILYQWMCNAIDNGVPTWVYSGELGAEMSREWIDPIMAGPNHVKMYESKNGTPYYMVDYDTIEQINQAYHNMCFFYKDGLDGNLNLLMDSMEEVIRRKGVRLLILDNMSVISTNEEDGFAEQKTIITKLVAMAKKFNVAILICIHPKKLASGQKVGLYDLNGSSVSINLAHRSLALKRITDEEKDGTSQNSHIPANMVGYDVIFTINKDRMRGKSGVDIGLYYDVMTRRFYTSKAELYHQYRFDTGDVSDGPYDKPDKSEVYGERFVS